MPDVDPLHQKQYVFGDVGGVVGDPLQIADDHHQVESLLDVAGVFLHEAGKFVVAGGAQAVDGVVGGEHAAGQVRVAMDESIERLPHHGLHQAGDVRNIDHGRDDGAFHQRQCALGNADRQVAHSFQVGVDLERGDDQAQVGRHGLVQSQQADGEFVDLDLDGVDARFRAKNFFGGGAVFLSDRADAALDGGLDDGAHLEQLGFQL